MKTKHFFPSRFKKGGKKSFERKKIAGSVKKSFYASQGTQFSTSKNFILPPQL